MMGAGVDRAVYIWNTGTWQLEHRLEGQPEMISALTLSQDGAVLVLTASLPPTRSVIVRAWCTMGGSDRGVNCSMGTAGEAGLSGLSGLSDLILIRFIVWFLLARPVPPADGRRLISRSGKCASR